MSAAVELEKKLSSYLTSTEIQDKLDLINKIRDIKEKKNILILGHNYMTPDIFHGLSDFSGDSLALAQKAAETDAEIILFNGVHFMAETAKILKPKARVLIADPAAGCSLSDSISVNDIDELRKTYPGIPIVCYINCSAAVKAEVDVICTSANAVKVVNSLPGDQVIMVPDQYLAENVALKTKKNVIAWSGKCIVHQLYTVDDLEVARLRFPGVKIIAHPECPTDVAESSDFSGSTSQMSGYIAESKAEKVMLLTECSMGDNLQSEFPYTEFIRSCQSCPHMKKITLEKILASVETETYEVEVPDHVIAGAQKSLNRMLEIGR
jgi:quinolinate synthase